MRRSGVSPAVKRWKLACEMLRRAASGHIEATQLSKFAAASRIALAVIKGWPEAPSSPLQGGAALLAGGGAPCACATVPARGATGAVWPPFESEPAKMLSRKPRGPPPEDCARAPPHKINATATIAALVCLFANNPDRRVMSYPQSPRISHFKEASSRFPIA